MLNAEDSPSRSREDDTYLLRVAVSVAVERCRLVSWFIRENVKVYTLQEKQSSTNDRLTNYI